MVCDVDWTARYRQVSILWLRSAYKTCCDSSASRTCRSNALHSPRSSSVCTGWTRKPDCFLNFIIPICPVFHLASCSVLYYSGCRRSQKVSKFGEGFATVHYVNMEPQRPLNLSYLSNQWRIQELADLAARSPPLAHTKSLLALLAGLLM